MIFISYTHKDKQLVDVIAQRLASVFGQEKVFYDSWSIQPGDGIIAKMEQGLKDCKFFFFFVSKNSLGSGMVSLEWQNAIVKATQGNVRFIPVKLDDCMMPQLLLQTLYIDVFGQGIEIAIRQMIDVIQGKTVYRPGPQTYENVRGYVKSGARELIIEFRAETYMEPISRYLILVGNNEGEAEIECLSDGMFRRGYQKDLTLSTGEKTNAFLISVDRATTPGFPLTIKLIQKKDQAIALKGLMRATSQREFQFIPMIAA